MKDKMPNLTHWNYRVVECKLGGYEIREVYYHEGKPLLSTLDGACAYGETIKELKKDLQIMKKAFDKPTLKESDFD